MTIPHYGGHVLNWTCLLIPAGLLPVDDGPECQACRLQVTREALGKRQCNACQFPGTCSEFGYCPLLDGQAEPSGMEAVTPGDTTTVLCQGCMCAVSIGFGHCGGHEPACDCTCGAVNDDPAALEEAMAAAAVLGAALARFENALDRLRKPSRQPDPPAAGPSPAPAGSG